MQGMKCICKYAGYVTLAFGAGILLTYFLPSSVLIMLESAMIIASGTVYILNR